MNNNSRMDVNALHKDGLMVPVGCTGIPRYR